MKKKIISLILLLFCMNFAAVVTVVNQCENKGATKTENATFVDDYLYMGKGLVFSGEAQDLVFLGESLEFSGKTRLGIIGAGKELLLTGTVGNGVIAVGKDILIDGDIIGTNYIGAKKLLISDSAKIKGDLFAGCSELTIDGKIDGNLYIGAGKININNEINGNVTVHGGRILISENGRINGGLSYTTKEKLSQSEQARVTGHIKFNESKMCKDEETPMAVLVAFKMIFHILFIIFFVIIGTILLFLPVFKKIETDRTPRTFWHTALWGLIPIVMYPALILVSIVMVITIPFALVLILAFIPLFFIAYIIGATMAGQFIVKKFKWNVQKRHYHFLIGALASAILSIIPGIDFLTVVLLSSLGWGTYISFLFRKSLVSIEPAKTDTPETKASTEE